MGLPPAQELHRRYAGPVEDLEHVVPVTVLVTINLDGDAREGTLEPQDRGDGVDFYPVGERVHEIQYILLQHPVVDTFENPAAQVRSHNFHVIVGGEAVQGIGVLQVVAVLLQVDDVPLLQAEMRPRLLLPAYGTDPVHYHLRTTLLRVEK